MALFMSEDRPRMTPAGFSLPGSTRQEGGSARPGGAPQPIPFPRPSAPPVPGKPPQSPVPPRPIRFPGPAAPFGPGAETAHRWVSREELFYSEARRKAGFDGPAAPEVAFFCYYPTYDSMSGPQQRWYFYWRSLVRRGNWTDTSLAYIFVYLFELINLIGVSGPEEGLARMLAVWRAYRGSHRELDRYLPAWVKSYVIFYGCAADYTELILDIDPQGGGKYLFVELLVRLFRFHKSEHILDIIDNISTYRVSRSKFVVQNHELMEKTLCAVLLSYNDYLISKKRRSLVDRFVKLREPARWYPFSGSVVYMPAHKAYCQNRDITILDCYRYFTDEAGQWYIDAPGSFYDYDRRTCNYIACIVKSTELTLRELCGSRGRLRRDGIPPDLLEAVRTLVTKYYYVHCATPEQKRALRRESEAVRTLPPEPVRFDVDEGKLAALQKESDETCALLMQGLDGGPESGAASPAEPAAPGNNSPAEPVGKPGPFSPAEPAEPPGGPAAGAVPMPDESFPGTPRDGSSGMDGFAGFAAALGPDKRRALRILLAGQDAEARLGALCRELGALPEPLLDDINALAMEHLGDCIADAGSLCVYDEYAGELARALGAYHTNLRQKP